MITPKKDEQVEKVVEETKVLAENPPAKPLTEIPVKIEPVKIEPVKPENKTEETGKPNTIFVGVRVLSNGDRIDMKDAPEVYNSGGVSIKLPSATEQRAGFFLEAKTSRRLRREFPTLYKEFNPVI